MKKIITLIMVLVICLSFTACGSKTKEIETQKQKEETKQVETEKEVTKETTEEEISKKEETKEILKEMNPVELGELLTTLPLTIESKKYVVQDEEYKSLYPDMLQIVLKNNTQADIRNAVIAFVAWDKNGLPVKLKGNMDFNKATYLRNINYADINLVSGGTFGENSGFSLDDSLNIASFEAIVVSFETFEDETWENPYVDEFTELYEGKKIKDDMSVEVKIEDIANTFEKAATNNEDLNESSISKEDLIIELSKLPMTIESKKYVVQDEEYKSLYPDMLQVVLKNNTQTDIRSAVVAFVAWDENGLPVKLKGDMDFNEATYLRNINYADINLVSGGTFGENSGFSLDDSLNIASFEAIVVSYETFEDETWENPCLKDFETLYVNKKIN